MRLTSFSRDPEAQLVELWLKAWMCHKQDPVIPAGARMSELNKLAGKENVTLIHSDSYGHANLSWDMMEALSKEQNGECVNLDGAADIWPAIQDYLDSLQG